MTGRPASLRLAIGRWARPAVLGLAALTGLLTVVRPAPANADEYGRLYAIEENDGLLPDGRDRHYTQGAMLAYLSPTLGPQSYTEALYDAIGGNTPLFQAGPGVQRKFDVVVGQTMFTPTRYHDIPPDPRDRPFAGYLFTGGSLLQDTDGKMLENLELLAGVVGPDSLAKDAQIWFHSTAGFNNTNLNQAWSYQLRNEPGFMLTYERKWRTWQRSFFGIEAEIIPEAGITAGNVMTYADAGATFRIGQNLGVDYGSPHIRPSISGTPWFDASRLTQDFGWYLFAGVQGRAVAHNIFLDGNTFANSPHVHKEILVGDFSTGASVFYRDWIKFDVSFTERTKEFTTQGSYDHFGTANLSVLF
jgi:lipid A 3-O-deacylase